MPRTITITSVVDATDDERDQEVLDLIAGLGRALARRGRKAAFVVSIAWDDRTPSPPTPPPSTPPVDKDAN